MVDMRVDVVGYDPAWHQKFDEQRDRLTILLSEWLAAPVEHVGSTAVTGLASKPIVDILAPVTSLVAAHNAVPLLAEDGWHQWSADPNRSWRCWFLRPLPESRTHHLYLIQYDDPHARELRAFRDALRANALRDRYAVLKQDLAKQSHGDREAYTTAKARFVEDALRQNGIEPLRRP